MISTSWLTALRLDQRHSPEFIRKGDNLNNIPHGAVIRQSFEQLNISAMHCISGVSTIAFLVLDHFDQVKIDQTHKALWNQGLVTLMMVITDETLHVYSLSQLPVDSDTEKQATDRLVTTFSLVQDAIELKDLVLGVESGRFITANEEQFDPKNRVDQVLLSNLEVTVKRLVDRGLGIESAQALLMQVMFIAYLEDKGIINSEYFEKAMRNSKINSLMMLLNDGRENKFLELFKLLKKHFNGDLFVAPCSFDASDKVVALKKSYIKVLAEFRSGSLNLTTGQYQFWPYDFRYIPIELISAVYDRFLGFNAGAKRESGAYYTPMFLADVVVEQAWDELSEKQKMIGQYVDPSCGSGIFLVRLFDKMVEQWRNEHNNQQPPWPSLLAILKRIHGVDIKKESIRVSAFSLYIALLEKSRPAEILKLMEKGRLLPKLCGETLLVRDFFDMPAEGYQYSLVIGNPPWVSRRGEQKSASAWCKENKRTMPGQEIAWGFAWKALSHCDSEGVIAALLLKATSFLSNHSSTFLNARKQWMENIHLTRVINFADLCFQLFDGANAPTSLMIYKPLDKELGNYRFDYWVPKADLNLKTRRLLTLASVDKATLPIQLAKEDHLLLKRRMWMQMPDTKLFQYVSSFPILGKKLITYQGSKKQGTELSGKWIIGQGFNPAQDHRLDEEDYKPTDSKRIIEIPHLKTNMLQNIVMPAISADAWHTSNVYRRNFEDGFKAPHILIPQGIEHTEGRLRASYCIQDLSFRHSIQAISFDKDDERQAKFLTLLLNSSLVAWFLFHHSSNTGMERSKVHQEQLLAIPFPSPSDMDDKKRAMDALNDAVELIDSLLMKQDEFLQVELSSYMQDIDNIIYRYFGFDAADITVIEDTLHHIVPSMRPRAKSKKFPSLWINTVERDWKLYGEQLSKSLTEWLSGSSRAVTELVGSSSDLAVIGVHLTEDTTIPAFQSKPNQNMDLILSKIWEALPSKLPGNFQLIPDLRVFIDDVLYLVKPRKRRFWLGSTALADAGAIATELLSQQSRK